MGKRGRHTIFISTDPQNNVPIGTPGQGVFIGYPGPTIYNASTNPSLMSGFVVTGGNIAFTPETVPVALEF